MRRVMMVGVLAVIAACAPGSTDEKKVQADPAADMAAITKIREGYMTAFKAGDAATIAGFFTAEGRDMENHTPTVVGPEGITAAMTGVYAAMTPTAFEIVSEKTDISGDLAYDRGVFRATMTPKAGGAAMPDSGRYLVILKRQADGSWKLVESMGNSTTPLPPAPAKK